MGHPRKKKRTQNYSGRQNDRVHGVTKTHSASRIPKSMVIRMGGRDGTSITQLVRDVRQIMEPHTASKLQERKSNRLRDYTTMAGPLGVTHFLLFYRAKESGNVNMKIAVTPRGPTLTFRIENYSLAKDVAKGQRHPKTGNAGLDSLTPPLLVLNNCTTPGSPSSRGTTNDQSEQQGQSRNPIPKQLESLTTSVFQSLFPPISPQHTPLSSIRRVMLVSRIPPPSDPSKDQQAPYTLHLRHYAITSRPVLSPSLSRGLKRLDRAKSHAQHRPYATQYRDLKAATEKTSNLKRNASKGALPDLGNLDDVADYLLEPGANGGYASASESEAEGTEAEVDVVEEPEAQRTWTRKEREEIRRRRSVSDSQQQRSSENGLSRGAGEEPRKAKKPLPFSRSTHKRAVKLTELGPRMQLRLYKIEEGMCGGRVMWHELVSKTEEEEQILEDVWRTREEEKQSRRMEQKENLERKRNERMSQMRKESGLNEDQDAIEGAREDVEFEDAEDWDDVEFAMDVDDAESDAGDQ